MCSRVLINPVCIYLSRLQSKLDVCNAYFEHRANSHAYTRFRVCESDQLVPVTAIWGQLSMAPRLQRGPRLIHTPARVVVASVDATSKLCERSASRAGELVSRRSEPIILSNVSYAAAFGQCGCVRKCNQ